MEETRKHPRNHHRPRGCAGRGLLVLPDQPGRGSAGSLKSASLAALALLAVACGSSPTPEPPPDPAALLSALDACPSADLPWVDAFKAQRDAETLEALLDRVEALDASCGGWQPAWLEARARLELQQVEPAVARFEAALDRASGTDDAVGVARSADQLGWISHVRGGLTEGRAYYERAIAAAERADRSDLEGFARNNFAGLLKDAGDFAGAVDQLGLAEGALADIGRPDAALTLAYNRATLLLELGDAVSARETLERIHAEARRLEDPWTVDASALVLGNLHRALRDYDAARRWHDRVSEADADLRLLARLGMGRTALDAGDDDEALRLLRAAAEGASEQGAVYAGASQIYLTEAELRAGTVEAAEARLAPWIEEGREDVPGEVAAEARWMLGRVRLHQGRADEALEQLTAAVDVLEGQGAALDPMSEGLRFLRQRRDPYVDLAVALATAESVGPDRAARVLQVITRAKARGLQRALREQGATVSVDLDRIQRGLEPGAVLLDYLIGDERGIVLAASRQRVEALPIGGRRDLATDLATLRAALTGGGSAATAAAERLRAALIEPVGDWLAGAKRLYVSPDDALALIPFEVLPDGSGGRLGDGLEIAVLPLSGVPSIDPGRRDPLLLAGQPVAVADAGFSELPWAAYELSKLREVWGAGRSQLLSGEALTLAGLDGLDLADYRTVHLATHAVASTVDPRRCGVVLSGGERLGLDRIVELDLDGALVVLSACRTGEGELIPGEGIVGLGWAFLRAGAAAVVTSLWSVDDAVSARLMVAFHDRLAAGVDPVAALAGARRETAALEPDPSRWAPFVIVLRPE